MLRQDSVRTRKRLLEAASQMFAEKGYQGATINEICERAGTNVAAVNYHFGNKEALYREAWCQSFRDSIKAHPPDGGVDRRAPVKRRLRGAIGAAVRRMTDKENREFMIVLKEVAHPTGLLQEVMRGEIAPLREEIESLIEEFFDRNGTKEQVRYCAISIIAQCVIPALINMAEKQSDEYDNDSWRIESIEEYANHVVDFSLAATRAIRNEEKNRRNTRI
jgi:TetR/AcrR family transcriptional regulator, regulator of cefoperazone and chloramphenicol sensitivity